MSVPTAILQPERYEPTFPARQNTELFRQPKSTQSRLHLSSETVRPSGSRKCPQTVGFSSETRKRRFALNHYEELEILEDDEDVIALPMDL
jgi:hypothetical protein